MIPRAVIVRCRSRRACRPQSRVSRRRSRHPLPSRHEGAAEGNAAAGRQADHPVRRRGGGRVGHRQHHPRHRPRQERDRGSLRRLGGARDVPRGARQARAARRGPQDLEHDQLRVRAPGRAARARPRGARHARAGRRRAVRRHPRRRCDRRRPAGDEADGRRVRAASTDRCSPSSACRARGLELRRHRDRAERESRRRRVPGARSGREAAARTKRRRTWRSSAATS